MYFERCCPHSRLDIECRKPDCGRLFRVQCRISCQMPDAPHSSHLCSPVSAWEPWWRSKNVGGSESNCLELTTRYFAAQKIESMSEGTLVQDVGGVVRLCKWPLYSSVPNKNQSKQNQDHATISHSENFRATHTRHYPHLRRTNYYDTNRGTGSGPESAKQEQPCVLTQGPVVLIRQSITTLALRKLLCSVFTLSVSNYLGSFRMTWHWSCMPSCCTSVVPGEISWYTEYTPTCPNITE